MVVGFISSFSMALNHLFRVPLLIQCRSSEGELKQTDNRLLNTLFVHLIGYDFFISWATERSIVCRFIDMRSNTSQRGLVYISENLALVPSIDDMSSNCIVLAKPIDVIEHGVEAPGGDQFLQLKTAGHIITNEFIIESIVILHSKDHIILFHNII